MSLHPERWHLLSISQSVMPKRRASLTAILHVPIWRDGGIDLHEGLRLLQSNFETTCDSREFGSLTARVTSVRIQKIERWARIEKGLYGDVGLASHSKELRE